MYINWINVVYMVHCAYVFEYMEINNVHKFCVSHFSLVLFPVIISVIYNITMVTFLFCPVLQYYCTVLCCTVLY
jgi:hypothetical protein